MSYAVSHALQTAVYGALSGDASLTALVGAAIYDAVPPGTVPELYVSIGPEEVSAKQDSAGNITTHLLILSVIGSGAGFASLKAAAGAVSDALSGAPLSLSRGHLISLEFQKARARKISENQERQIELWFRAIVEDSYQTE